MSRKVRDWLLGVSGGLGFASLIYVLTYMPKWSQCGEARSGSKGEILARIQIVIRGLDPRIHPLEKMNCQVKPGNDEGIGNDGTAGAP
jgi:hypothetical protein